MSVTHPTSFRDDAIAGHGHRLDYVRVLRCNDADEVERNWFSHPSVASAPETKPSLSPLTYVWTANHHLAAFVPFHLLRPPNLPLAGTAMTTAETEFAYRIDRWDTYGGNIVHHIANLDDLELAMAAYEAACKQWPGELITLRQGARIIKATRV